jgi:hypothetical protein
MPLPGDIDFQQSLTVQGLTIFRSFEQEDRFRLLPQALEIAVREASRPDFVLELVRPQNPLSPPQPYGVLDMRVQPQYRIQEALELLRQKTPSASADEAVFESGFMRLAPAGDLENAPQELFQPVALAWNGLGVARFVLRLPLSSALLLKDALLGEILPLRAIAEMTLSGVSPRLPVNVRFDPARLIGAVLALGNSERKIVWQGLVQFFRRDIETLPLQLATQDQNLAMDEFAESMADHVCHRWGKFVPASGDDQNPYCVFPAPAEVGSGSFEWDLSEPITVLRPLVLSFDPLDLARQLIRDVGPDVVIRQTIIPPINVGTVPVMISANLPAHRMGVLSLGVTINAAPHPPARPQAIIKTVELVEPEDSARVLLRLSPTESPDYVFTTFAILDGQEQRYEGQPTQHSGDRLDLQPGDFPLSFVQIDATSELIELADVRLVCRQTRNGSSFEQSFTLNRDQALVVIALPKDTNTSELEIEAHSKDGQQMLRLGPLPAETLRLGLMSFREYGSHKVEIECVFTGDIRLVAIDLLPEGRAETTGEITTLHFTPAQNKKDWIWLAKSPFYAGYKYRLHSGTDGILGTWSETQSPFERLVINAGLMQEVAA